MRSFAIALSGYEIIWGSMFCASTDIALYLCLLSNVWHLGFARSCVVCCYEFDKSCKAFKVLCEQLCFQSFELLFSV